MCDQQSLRPACAYAQSDQSLCLSLEYFMSVKLLTEHHLEFLSLKGGCTGSSESALVKVPQCWKAHVMAHFCFDQYCVGNHAGIYQGVFTTFFSLQRISQIWADPEGDRGSGSPPPEKSQKYRVSAAILFQIP